MKKLLPLFLTLAMLISLCACNNTYEKSVQTSKAPAEPDNSIETETHLWIARNYIDEFEQPTDESYIVNSTYFVGTFNNSATTKSKLRVKVIVDGGFNGKGRVTFFLYEYGSHQVKNSSSISSDYYNITMRTDDGTDVKLTGVMYRGSDRIYVEDKYVQNVIDALSEGTTTYFYIEDSERTTTNYLFSVSSDNFAELYEELFQ